MRSPRPENSEEVSKGPARAAQYVRMSTDHQKYSTDNQKDAIAAYAATHDLTIVQTYEDEGRSGLRLEGRDALSDSSTMSGAVAPITALCWSMT